MNWLAKIVVVLTVAAAGAAGVYWKWIDIGSFSSATAPGSARPNSSSPIAVEVASAEARMISEDISSIGTLQSDESVQLMPEVAGRIAEIHFTEGQSVKAGSVLVSLDTALVRASEEEVKVRLELANANYDRARRLAQSGTGTTRDLDAALAERNTANALLNSQKVQLAKHQIVAPFDGVVGFRNSSVGSYVSIGTTLVNLEKIDVLKVGFKIPEANLQKVRVGQSIEVLVDAIPGKPFSGTVYAIDPMLDVNGRAVSIRAKLPNVDLTLRPGLFARITLKGENEQKVVTVPEAAIVARGQDRFVWTVEGGKVRENKVMIAARTAGSAQIDGLAPGSIVVTAGHARLRSGVPVDIIGSSIAQAEG